MACVRRAPAADDKLLPGRALGLEPVNAPAGPIGRCGQLRDYALEVELAGMTEESRTIADDVLGI
jgi:hypothetical protein